MTIQGAIYELNNMLSSNDIPCYWKPAIKKIIETVEQNVGEISEQTDGDLISRELAKQMVRDRFNDLSERVEINTVLNEVPSAEKTAEEPIKHFGAIECPNCGRLLMLEEPLRIKVENPEIKVDLISRAEAIECCFNGWNKDFNEIAEDIKKLPAYPTGIQTKVFETAIKCCENVLDKMKDMSKEELLELARNTAEQPTAEWLFDEHIDENMYCSNCGFYRLSEYVKGFKYCPNCGAKMRGDNQ